MGLVFTQYRPRFKVTKYSNPRKSVDYPSLHYNNTKEVNIICQDQPASSRVLERDFFHSNQIETRDITELRMLKFNNKTIKEADACSLNNTNAQ